MGTKKNPGAFDCHAMAAEDEPLFTLLARDKDAPLIIRMLALVREMQIEAGVRPETDRAQIEEARRCAYEMDRWRSRKGHGQ